MNKEKKDECFDTYEKRLAFLIKKVGGNATAAELMGKSDKSVERYKSGQDAPFKGICKLAKAGDISVQWLVDGEKPETTEHDPYAAIPVMNAQASAGGGALPIDENRAGYIKFDKAWLHNNWHLNPADLFTISSVGESMEPTIKAGEYLLVSRAERHLKPADGIYIVRLEGDVLVKRIQRLPGRKLIISSDNTAYKPYEIKLDDGVDFDILGKVVLVHGVRKV